LPTLLLHAFACLLSAKARVVFNRHDVTIYICNPPVLFLFCADFLIVTNVFLLALLVKHCHSLDFKQDQLRFIVVITGLSLFALICYHSNPMRSQSMKMRLLFRRSRYCNCIHHLHLHNI